MDERTDFEPDPSFPSFMGPGWEQADPNEPIEFERPVLANADDPDEFPAESADDITGLLTLGYLASQFELYGHDFTIRTLTRGEKMDALALAKEYDGALSAADAVQTALLAAAIVLVDGHPPTSPLSPDEKPLARIRRNFLKLSDWYDPVLEGIYDEYSNLVQRQTIAFDVLLGKSTAGRRSP